MANPVILSSCWLGLASTALADGVGVTESVHAIVVQAAAEWQVVSRTEIAVVTVEALDDGRIVRVDESWSQPVGSLAVLVAAVQRLAGGTVRAAGTEPILCVARIVKGGAATACLPADGVTELLGWEDAAREGSDASRDLFAGFSAESDTAALRALAAFKRAEERAPTWTLAALALGLSLARAGRLDDAKPHLERWAKAGGLVTAEVKSYIGGDWSKRAASSAALVDTSAPPETVSTCERKPSEVSAYIEARWPRLIACVQEEKAPMPPSLPVSFLIRPDGTVANVTVEHRHFRKGALSGCIAGVLQEPLAPHAGADCPSRFDIEVKRVTSTGDP